MTNDEKLKSAIDAVVARVETISTASGTTASGSSDLVGATTNTKLELGKNTKAIAINSVAIGVNTQATGRSSVAIGITAKALNSSSVAIGQQAVTEDVNAVAIGATATASDRNIAIGFGTLAKSQAAAIGYKTKANATGATAIGSSVQVVANYATAIGYAASVTGGDNAMAIGRSAKASGRNSTAIGSSSIVTTDSSTAIGASANASGAVSVAVGAIAKASGQFAVALGVNALAPDGAVSAGYKATASNYGVAIGNNAKSNNPNGIALGTETIVNHVNSVAIGNHAATAAPRNTPSIEIAGTQVEVAGGTPWGVISFGNENLNGVSVTRQLKQVSAGEVSASSTDAVNGSQLYAVVSNLGAGGKTTEEQIIRTTRVFTNSEIGKTINYNGEIVAQNEQTLTDFIEIPENCLAIYPLVIHNNYGMLAFYNESKEMTRFVSFYNPSQTAVKSGEKFFRYAFGIALSADDGVLFIKNGSVANNRVSHLAAFASGISAGETASATSGRALSYDEASCFGVLHLDFKKTENTAITIIGTLPAGAPAPETLLTATLDTSADLRVQIKAGSRNIELQGELVVGKRYTADLVGFWR